MKFLVKIDRATIKRNPRAYSTQSMVKRSNSTVTVDCQSSKPLPKDLEEHVLGIKSEGSHGSRRYEFKLLFIEEKAGELYDRLTARGFENILMHLDNGMRPVNHFPAPPYFYEYEPTEVECDHCHARFLHTKLEDAEDSEGDYTEEVCPRCHRWDCCSVQYERFTGEDMLVFK